MQTLCLGCVESTGHAELAIQLEIEIDDRFVVCAVLAGVSHISDMQWRQSTAYEMHIIIFCLLELFGVSGESHTNE